ncbi:MAG: hypothetical protein ACTSWY_10090 [Promethearchaeota archaeon]
MPTAYCPVCKREVMTKREDLDVGLAIFLLCCTFGVGIIIYLIVYFMQPEDKCIFCSSQTEPVGHQRTGESYTPYPPEQKIEPEIEPYKTYSSETVYDGPTQEGKSSGKKFCPMCGTKFKIGQKYCENCGGDLRDFV